MQVLVADDDTISRSTMALSLKEIEGVEIREASSGDEVLENLIQSPVDLLLIDWEMPGRTGLEITRILRNLRSPLPIILVTATAERERVIEALRTGVSEYVVKPFEPDVLRSKVEYWLRSTTAQTGGVPIRAEARDDPRSAADSSSTPPEGSERPLLASVLRQIEDVSTIPEMATRFVSAANDPNAKIEDLGDILSKDPALASRVLRLVNSSAFALRQRVTNLELAIGHLGIKQVRNLAVAVSVSDLFRTSGNLGTYSRVGLWRHMVAVGLCARLIARCVGVQEAEDAFLAGLLHDIGIVLEDQYVHQPFCKILRGLAPDRPLIEQEREHLSFDHATLGSRVAENWGFPPAVLAAIRYHHASMECEAEEKVLVRCVELANVVCSTQSMTSVGVNLVKTVGPGDLELTFPGDSLKSLAQDLRKEIAQSAALFEL